MVAACDHTQSSDKSHRLNTTDFMNKLFVTPKIVLPRRATRVRCSFYISFIHSDSNSLITHQVVRTSQQLLRVEGKAKLFSSNIYTAFA